MNNVHPRTGINLTLILTYNRRSIMPITPRRHIEQSTSNGSARRVFINPAERDRSGATSQRRYQPKSAPSGRTVGFPAPEADWCHAITVIMPSFQRRDSWHAQALAFLFLFIHPNMEIVLCWVIDCECCCCCLITPVLLRDSRVFQREEGKIPHVMR